MSTDKNPITESLRAALQQPETPVQHKNGKWTVRDRKAAWIAAGPLIFDDHVERLRAAAVEVLTERDPAFDLDTEERFAARVRGKEMKHSAAMRDGLAESLALLGCFPQTLPHVTAGKAEGAALLAVRDILGDASWDIWASLNGQLPMLAEAAPEEFMSSVEKALHKTPSPFADLFAQETGGALGRQYMSGLLWALETLAWSEDHLARVAVILGGLAAIDPGGQWSNRPLNSLTEILLPWLPQTCAKQEQRIASVKALLKNHPEVGWKLLLQLLPEAHQSSSETRKPTWRPYIPDNWERGVTNSEYWTQTEAYAELALEMAASNFPRQLALVNRIGEFPIAAGKKLFGQLLAGKDKFTEEQREQLWSSLVETTTRHKRFAKAEWAMAADRVAEIDKVADDLKPTSPALLSKRLFSRNSDLYEDTGDIEAQEKKIADLRTQAAENIYAAGGLAALLKFALEVDSTSELGWAIGRSNIPSEVEWLPKLLADGNSPTTSMVRGFVRGRFFNHGEWTWVDALKIEAWTDLQRAQLFSVLPFCEETWTRAIAALPDNGRLFWQRTDANPYRAKTNLTIAIRHLLDNERPVDAIRALSYQIHQQEPVDEKLAVRALHDLLDHQEQFARSNDGYEVLEVIKALQDSTTVDPNDLFRVEWSYLPLLDDTRGSSPKLLSQKLATEPTFFCEVIREIYRSKHDEAKKPEEPSEKKKKMAEVAFKLLRNWKRPPGKTDDGTFDAAVLKSWLADVRTLCETTGHVEIAETHLGHVLKYTPPDPSGLWIHKGAAEVLNEANAEEMRSGYRCEWFNSRGAHWGTGGKEELKLAEFFKEKAVTVETEGFIQLGATLRDLAKGYEREAARDVAGDWPE